MKVSVSLPVEDVEFLDAYAREHRHSRSAAVHAAIETLRGDALAEAYADAFRTLESSPDAALWEATTGDGIEDAPG